MSSETLNSFLKQKQFRCKARLDAARELLLRMVVFVFEFAGRAHEKAVLLRLASGNGEVDLSPPSLQPRPTRTICSKDFLHCGWYDPPGLAGYRRRCRQQGTDRLAVVPGRGEPMRRGADHVDAVQLHRACRSGERQAQLVEPVVCEGVEHRQRHARVRQFEQRACHAGESTRFERADDHESSLF